MSGRKNLFNSKRGMLLPLFCGLMSVLASSCTDEQPLSVTIIKDVEVSDTLHGRLVIDPDKVLFSPSALTVCGDALLTYTPGKELLFDLWDLNDNCRHISAFGYEGRAANEFNQVVHTSLVATDSSFSVFCAGDMRYKTVKICDGKVLSVESSLKFPTNFGIDRIHRIDDSVFTCTSHDFKYEFQYLNIRTGNTVYFGNIVSDWSCLSLSENNLHKSMSSGQCVNPHTGAMAVYYVCLKKVRFYDSSLDLVRDIDVQIEPYNICYKASDKDSYYYIFPYSTCENIYVICCNGRNQRESTDSELQIWDWEGNLKSRYVLDKGIFHVVCYPKRNVIFGETVNDELYEFQLP